MEKKTETSLSVLKNVPIYNGMVTQASSNVPPFNAPAEMLKMVEAFNMGREIDKQLEEDAAQAEANKKIAKRLMSDPYLVSVDCPNCSRTMVLTDCHAQTGFDNPYDDKVALGFKCKSCPVAIVLLQPARWMM